MVLSQDFSVIRQCSLSAWRWRRGCEGAYGPGRSSWHQEQILGVALSCRPTSLKRFNPKVTLYYSSFHFLFPYYYSQYNTNVRNSWDMALTSQAAVFVQFGHAGRAAAKVQHVEKRGACYLVWFEMRPRDLSNDRWARATQALRSTSCLKNYGNTEVYSVPWVVDIFSKGPRNQIIGF